MTLLDEAFDAAKDAFGKDGRAQAVARLRDHHPGRSADEAETAFERGRALADACHDFGDRCRSGATTDDVAVREMRRRFPGFSDATYRAALSHGYFVSR